MRENTQILSILRGDTYISPAPQVIISECFLIMLIDRAHEPTNIVSLCDIVTGSVFINWNNLLPPALLADYTLYFGTVVNIHIGRNTTWSGGKG